MDQIGDDLENLRKMIENATPEQARKMLTLTMASIIVRFEIMPHEISEAVAKVLDFNNHDCQKCEVYNSCDLPMKTERRTATRSPFKGFVN